MIAGGFDDISEEGSFEFANMKATSNAETEFAMGREPTEMSRPATTSRAGVRCFSFHLSITLLTIGGPIVYGSTGYWCSYCHECQDCTGTWCSNSRYSGVHIDIHVSCSPIFHHPVS